MNISGVSLTSSIAKVPEARPLTGVLRRLIQSAIWVILGLFGGATGVGLAIALAIGLQSKLAPTVIFSPSASQLTIVSTVMGLGVSWLLSQVANLFLPGLFHHALRQGLKVVLAFSIFASLVQTFLFFTHGL